MAFDAIGAALDAYLGRFANLPDIAWEGVVYQPTSGRPYVAPRMGAYTRQPAGMGEGTAMLESGVYAINVNWPIGQGRAPAARMASALVDYFNRHVSMTLSTGRSLRLLGSSAAPPIEANGWLTIPVAARWISDEPEAGG